MIGRYVRLFLSAIPVLAIGVVLTSMATSFAQAQTSRVFCVLVPHFKDDYWLSVAYRLKQEAKRRGIALEIFEAGGYQSRHAQIDQIKACGIRGVDAILLGAVTSDHPDLLAEISAASTVTRVFGLVNELHSDALSGRVGVDWHDMGRALGDLLATRFPSGSSPKKAVLISGPRVSGWAGPLEGGLRMGLRASAVEIAQVYGADTGLREQLDLVHDALAGVADIDLLIGSAPAIEAAMGVLANGRQGVAAPLLFATYVSHSVKRGVLNGTVEAAPFDDPMMQGILAIRQAVRVLDADRREGLEGPRIVLLERGEDQSKVTVSPSGFFPTLR